MIDHLVFQEIDSLTGISDLRTQYLDELLEAQELYLEIHIRKSKVIVIQSDNRGVGYFLLGDDATLLEYYVNQDYINQADRIFRRILGEYSIKSALCKSFDHTLLSCCAGMQKTVKAVGIHFRKHTEKPARTNTEKISVRPADFGDERKILAINEEVFDHEEEVGEYIRKEQVLIFEKDQEIIGFGIFARVIEGRPEFDIGMLVDKRYRWQGYGEYIVRFMTEYCKRKGWRPICGCDIKNEGSRRCLEKAGYTGGYRLLKFEF